MRHWRRRMLALGAAVIVGGSAGAAHAATCGDLNGNNVVGSADPADAVAMIQVVSGANPGTSFCGGLGSTQCGDLNQSGGALNTADLIFLLQVVNGNETLFTPCTSPGPVLACNSQVSGNITSNQQWPAGCDTFIDGTVLVNPGVVVTVQPGAVVKGRKTSSNGTPSALIFTRDSKINAPGTAVSPIVFTSDQAPGARSVGDWGGLTINGRAPVNFPGGTGSSEGLPPGLALFGGNEANDSSGVIRFARIEFSGIEFSTDNELNVFTMNAVGRGTTIDHVQANVGFDDGHEWFGGTVRASHLVATNIRDDSFDWQIGFTGAVQFGLAYQNAAIATGSGRHGFEADNNEFGFNNLPRSNPSFCNMTMIGSSQQAVVAGRSGANLRRGTAGKIANTIFQDWTAGAFDIDNDETLIRGCTNGTTLQAVEPILRVSNTVAFNNGASQVIGSSTAPSCTPTQLYGLWAANTGLVPADPSTVGPNPGLGITATYPTAVDNRYFPAAAGPADGLASCGLEPDFFVPAPYAGAFVPGGGTAENWLVTPGGWISFAAN